MSSDNAGLGGAGPGDAGPGDDSGDIGDTDADIGILFQCLLAKLRIQDIIFEYSRTVSLAILYKIQIE